MRDLCRIAFEHVGLDFEAHAATDPALRRPAEVDHLRGDSSCARERLGWARTVDFASLVAMMVDADLARHSSRDAIST